MMIHVERRGEGPDLVLLHGWALHGGLWGRWIEQLEVDYRLHLVDLPGHGHSPWSPSIRTLGDLAATLHPVIPPASIVLGWSLGGMLAMEIAARGLLDLQALVLVATTPRFLRSANWEPAMAGPVLEEFAHGLAGDHEGTVRNFLALQTRGDECAAATLRFLRRELASHGPPDPAALRAGLQILGEADLRSLIGQIAVPALVVAGERDRLTPPDAARALAAGLQQARFSLIPRAGHAPFLSHPEEFLDSLRPFLAGRADQHAGAARGHAG